MDGNESGVQQGRQSVLACPLTHNIKGADAALGFD